MYDLIRVSRLPAVADFISDHLPRNEVEGVVFRVDWRRLGFMNDYWSGACDEARASALSKLAADRGGCEHPDGPGSRAVKVVLQVNCEPWDYEHRFQVPRALSGGHPVVVEKAAPCNLLVHYGASRPELLGGTSCGPAGTTVSGTLGGCLVDAATLDAYALTCWHVLIGPDRVTQPARVHDSSAAEVGTKTHEKALVAATSFAFNDPYCRSDVALIKLDAGIGPGEVRTLVKPPPPMATVGQLQAGDPVVFVGKESDQQHGKVAGFVGRKKIHAGPITYLGGDLIEINARHPVSTFVAQEGDSGSWVLGWDSVHARATAWHGVLMAGDGTTALAGFAEFAIADLNCGFTLIPP